MAPHSSTLAWKIPWTEEPGGLRSMGSLRVDTTEWLHFHFSLSCTGEGNGNSLQCSCLENPRDGGAWWAAVYGVTQSRTWLKRRSSSSSVYMSIPNLSHHPFPHHPVYMSILYVCISIPVCKWLTCTIFLGFTCALICNIHFSLSDVLHSI